MSVCIQHDGYPSQKAVRKDDLVASERGIACHDSEKEETAAVEPGRMENDEERRYAGLTTFCTRDTTWPSDF
jgi:hypothetical protein